MTFDEMNALYGFEEVTGFPLRELQKEDIGTFLAWRWSLNRYEVGGGKTVVSTAVSLMSGAEVTVVAVLPVLIPPWVRWLKRLEHAQGTVLEYRGTPTGRKLMDLKAHRWIVMSHAIFRTDFDRIYQDLRGKHADLIIDEAHALKNPESKLYTSTGVFVNRPKGGLQLLTGTPTSKPEDSYAYMRLCRLPYYRSFPHFESTHIMGRDMFDRVTGYTELALLSERFKKRSISRSKFEIHGYKNDPLYPDTTYELSVEHYALYEKMVDEQLLEFDDGQVIDMATETKLRIALQKVIVNYDFYADDPKCRSTAYDLIDAVIEQTDCVNPEKSKLIIWTYYKLTSRSVLKYLADKGIRAVGAYSEVNTSKNIDLFHDEPTVRIGVFQYQSAGAGLNPQGVCSENLFLEATTVPLYMRQAMGRTDRVGQKSVPIMRLAQAAGTIQVGLLETLLNKDETVVYVEQTKNSLRAALLGQKTG